jgi:hypothetical protein
MGSGDGLHDKVPDASHSPTNEPVVAGRVRPKPFRQIAPRRARPQYPEDAVEDAPVVDPRHSAWLIRKEWSDDSPLKVREFISHDSRSGFGSLNHVDPGLRNVDFRSEMGRIADMLQLCRKRNE